jgi:hypothetical protein
MVMELLQILHLTGEKRAFISQVMRPDMTRGTLFSPLAEQLSSKIHQMLPSQSIFTSHSAASMAAHM